MFCWNLHGFIELPFPTLKSAKCTEQLIVYSREVDLSTVTNQTRDDGNDNPDVRFRHLKGADKSNLRSYVIC